MSKAILFSITLITFITALSQGGYIVLKKRDRVEQLFWKDTRITFQTTDGQWVAGIITKIKSDSFYLTQEIIRYNMTIDTLHISGMRFALSDIKALPGRKEQIVYRNDQVYVILGDEKFAWIRNGFIFQLAGAGYIGLNVINDVIQKEPPFAKNKINGLVISAIVFITGTFLHIHFDPNIQLGRKYHLECITLPTTDKPVKILSATFK